MTTAGEMRRGGKRGVEGAAGEEGVRDQRGVVVGGGEGDHIVAVGGGEVGGGGCGYGYS